MTSLQRNPLLPLALAIAFSLPPAAEASISQGYCADLFLTRSARALSNAIVYVAPVMSMSTEKEIRSLEARLQHSSKKLHIIAVAHQDLSEPVAQQIQQALRTPHHIFSGFDRERSQPLRELLRFVSSSSRPTVLVTTLENLNGHLATEYTKPSDVARLMTALAEVSHDEARYISDRHRDGFVQRLLAEQRAGFLAPGTETFFAPYEAAQDIARENKLHSRREWEDWIRAHRPRGIPLQAAEAYRGAGWVSWTEFFGPKFLSYAETSAWARQQGIKTRAEWDAVTTGSQRPENIPASPHQTFKNDGWISWPQFLGTDFIAYEEAAKWAQSNGIRSSADWKKRTRGSLRPDNIPAAPDVAYPEWKSWPAFLGSEFVSYEEASAWAQAKGIRTQLQWSQLTKGDGRPLNIPSTPSKAYAGAGWTNWKAFLGTDKP